MVNYEVTVYTTNCTFAATFNNVNIKLVGTEGKSNRSWLFSIIGSLALFKGDVAHFTVSCPKSLGTLFLIELDKQDFLLFQDSWYPSKVEVRSPEGDTYCFPVHRWITDREVHRFREGKAVKAFEETNTLATYAREQELIGRKKDYCWDESKKGLPHCIKGEIPLSLPPEVTFSYTKHTEFFWTAAIGQAEQHLKGLEKRNESWTDIDALDRVFTYRTTDMSEYVQELWQEDEFFAYQYLNGVNPIMIRCCKVLPKNFPVTNDMVFLHGHGSLTKEIERGNIFLCDYKRLDGVTPNTINGKKQYLMAPLVLFHKRQGKLMPIAIQLKQTPADDNPIFLPTDSAYDWMMAKIFVRSADFQEHQLNVHLLRTHLLAEVFAVSLLRNVPMVHPLYKLLVPHTRYTLQINIMARLALISEKGVFTEFAASGGEAMITIMERSLSSMTYKSLCIPDDVDERGVRDIPNYYYKDDGLKLWDIIFKFVEGVLSYYYKTDDVVVKDSELQDWIQDIFEHGFLSQEQTGIPQKLSTVDELIKFVTMVIFTCSCQHSAVNSGQYDYGAWMPNTPISLQRPPPTTKGPKENIMMQTLPDISTTVKGMSTMWLLSKESSDFVPLGQYPEQYFTEGFPRKQIKRFQRKLHQLSVDIKIRNEPLNLPYTYLDPASFENSVAI
ncbi:hydroperoxide isomerase ALOXE3-like [Hippoglossus hippoglossus]|uniref:hydroperoxide isomerase ALOXE3-like n=1 Tax=Hippoglossus hippoglossus TaxID=8267 RepID=UPI00148C8B7C|nr:hydroperoxide isomerase ALOXE3-like [Hippoglossus hippoglossus]XP_034443721.1 hydroperoxide isomerase ALOXE3-like [Hippoglossus hippoglossus]